MAKPLFEIGDTVKIVGYQNNGEVGTIKKVIEDTTTLTDCICTERLHYYLVNDITVPEHWLELIKRQPDMIQEAMDKVYKQGGRMSIIETLFDDNELETIRDNIKDLEDSLITKQELKEILRALKDEIEQGRAKDVRQASDELTERIKEAVSDAIAAYMSEFVSLYMTIRGTTSLHSEDDGPKGYLEHCKEDK